MLFRHRLEEFATGVPKLLLEKGACSRAWCFASGMSRAQASQLSLPACYCKYLIVHKLAVSSLLQTSCEA